jgi:hypothetical protein
VLLSKKGGKGCSYRELIEAWLEQAIEETPRRSGASQGYREERYMYVSM